ncbi:MAG: hypothetical protein ISS19_12025 [Bacteroidales bacterium]|nr:hypothetical protein [Bacteroidales bacterium]
MKIDIREVKSKADRRLFIKLPARIHADHSNWVPPIYMDDRQYFNPAKNKSFKYCDAILFLAIRDGKVDGRIMGIINHRYNELHNENHARFSFMECWNAPEVANALLEAVRQWAGKKGMDKLVGPLGFSDKDPQGFLVYGFDAPMVIATNCNFPYMVDLVQENGFSKKVDLVVYKVDIPDEIPELYRNIYQRFMERNNVTIEEPTRKKHLKSLIRPVLSLLNDTFTEVYGFDQMEGKEMDEFAARYIPILDPKFVKVVKNSKLEVVGFIIGMPDVSKGIVKARGRLFPFGIFQIIRAGKKTKQLNLLLGAIREDFRGIGLDAALAVKIIETATRSRMEYIDSHLELEDNTKVRSEMERFGGKVYKRYRIFEKDIRAES